jgi:hypothetical protein
MKVNRTLIQIVLIILTFLIMGLIIYGISIGVLLNYNETQELMLRGTEKK